MKVTINGIEFDKTGTIGCRWISTRSPGSIHENMMTDDACDQIAALVAEVERLRRVEAAAKAYRDDGYLGTGGLRHHTTEAYAEFDAALDAAESGE